MRPILLLFVVARLYAQPVLSFVANTTPGVVDIRLAAGSAAAGVQLSFAVPPGATITAGPAIGAKTLNSCIQAGAATAIVVGGQGTLTDGVLAQVTFPPVAWPFSAINALAVDPAGMNVPGVSVVGLAFSPPQPSAPIFQRDFWKFAAPGYRLSYPVAGGEKNALVYLNGMLLLQGLDYQLVGTLLQITGPDILHMQTPVVQVIYWH